MTKAHSPRPRFVPWRLLLLSITFFVCLPFGVRGFAEETDRPNFVVILADDLGYGDLGCFGSTTIKTPHLDRMAAEGTRFTDFYTASPLCTPSRVALLTGCYPKRVGLERGVLRPDSKQGIHSDETTLAELLQSGGYATMCIGKWHVGFVPPFRPRAQGFDEYYGLFHNLDTWEEKYFVEDGGVPLLRNDEIVKRPVDPAEVTELYTDEAVRFIRSQRDRPFFLYLAHTMPHEPFDVPAARRGKSADGLYGDVVEHLDASTGRILQTLRSLGLAERTMVFFTSDNGPALKFGGSAGPLRDGKHSTFEGGMRIPCIAWGSRHVARGQVCREVATIMDFYATFARLAGQPLPANRVIDGKDISSLLAGTSGAGSPHDAFYYHRGNGELQAVRAGRWKLILHPKPALFDLANDIGETEDVASGNPEVVARLRSLAERFESELQRDARPVGIAKGRTPGLSVLGTDRR